MTPLQRLERAQTVMFWRESGNRCTYKWIGVMIGKPAGACKAMHEMAASVRELVGGKGYDVVADVKRWLDRYYNPLGKIQSKRGWVKDAQVRKLAKLVGARTFMVNGRIYVDWATRRGVVKIEDVLRIEQLELV
jgi:hypothetical protein